MKIMLLPIITLIWVTAGAVIAWTMPAANQLRATPAAFYHVPMAIAMEIAFVLSALYGIGWLRGRRVESDARSVAYAEVGFAFGIVALITGSVWAKINWNSYWSWDPQQIGIVATLLTYAALFSLRGATEDDLRRRDYWAVYAILGVIAAIFWTFVFRHLTSFSLHPSKTLTGSDPLFKFALRFNIVGFTMLLIWIANLRTRVTMVEERLHDRALQPLQPLASAANEETKEAKDVQWVSN
ncbi:MAG: heme exporter protein [Abditibacteriota bacterium]|jgi:heme exporter protein C|nr:heme exporter protein [Abditibacteriota bacterium]